MKLSFRQGVFRRGWGLHGSEATNFLRKTSLSGATIDIVVSPDPVIVTFAHYESDYLVEEVQTVVAAWGSGTDPENPDITNEPFPPAEANQTQYLYWDIGLHDGQLRRGWTLLPPLYTSIEPVNPQHGQFWFDNINTVSKFWSQPTLSRPGKWVDCIRVFAATYNGANTIEPFPLGSQAGITGDFYSGYIILGRNNLPLRQQGGTFVTTETNLIVQQSSTETVKFDMALVYGKAIEEIPQFHLVTFLPNSHMQLASCLNTVKFVCGLVTEDLAENEVGLVLTNGLVRNEQWAWADGDIGRPLFCGTTGELTLTPPGVGISQQVGHVYSSDSVYLNLFPPVRL